MSLMVGDEHGRQYDLLALQPRDVRPQVLAARLAKINRCAGATPWPYSVATHSVLVSYLCPPEEAWGGLTHDLTEALVGDVISPIKHAMKGPETYAAPFSVRGENPFKMLENVVREQLSDLLGIPRFESEPVKAADRRAWALEAKCLRGRAPSELKGRFKRSREERRLCERFLSSELSWTTSYFLFMERWKTLRPRRSRARPR